MKKAILSAVSALTAISFSLAAVPAEAQYRHHDRWDRSDRHDRWDRDHRADRRTERRWRNWGGHYGYDGYRGHWRTGQRYTNWRNSRYYVTDYRAYGLPAPRRGYRYYRDSNGDIVMAAIATGLIVSILSR